MATPEALKVFDPPTEVDVLARQAVFDTFADSAARVWTGEVEVVSTEAETAIEAMEVGTGAAEERSEKPASDMTTFELTACAMSATEDVALDPSMDVADETTALADPSFETLVIIAGLDEDPP